MATNAEWAVTFKDSTRVTVFASSKRMAQAKAVVATNMPHDQILYYGKVSGKARNGNMPRGSNRNRKSWRKQYGEERSPFSSPYTLPWNR